MRLLHRKVEGAPQGAEDTEAARLDRQAKGLAEYALGEAMNGRMGEELVAKTSRFNLIPQDLSETVFAGAAKILSEWGLAIQHQRRYVGLSPDLPIALPRHIITVQPLEFTD